MSTATGVNKRAN